MTLIKAKFGLLVSLFTWSNMVFAAAPADQNFDAITPQESAQQNNPSITFNGVIYSADTTSEVIRVDTISNLTGMLPTLGSGNGITSAWYNSSGTYFQFASVSNLNDFKLESLRAEVWGGGSLTAEVYTVTGYNDGNPVPVVSATVTFTADGTYGVGNAAIVYDRQTTPAEEANSSNSANAGLLTFGSAWTGIDQVRFTAADGKPLAFMMDQIDFSDVDSTPPTITSINSSTANGTYKVGDVISIQINFSETVLVTGTPQLTVETGTTDRTINYNSGSNSSTLTFSYTVQSGDTTADLDYVATNSLTLNSGTIRDAASNNGTLTLPSPGAANSLGANKNIVIDGVVPTVSSVNASTANGTYKLGDSISIQVNFSEAVTVTGTPQLTLETGTTDRTVNYTSGSGTSTLTFNYSIQSGDLSSDLDYVATNSLSLNGGTIRDAAANNATLTLASPGAANSLGSNKAIVVDGAVPFVNSTVPDGGAVSTDTSVVFTVNFSESVSNISTDDFALGTTGGATGTIASVSASSGSSVTVTVSGIAGNGSIKLNLNASTNITDAAGNSGPAAYTSGTAHTVAIPTAPDAPTIGTATAGDGQVSVTFTAPGNNGGSAITTYTATANPGGAFGTCAGPAACTATVTGLSNGTAYTFTLTATNAVGTSVASGASNSATPKGNQTITFAQPSAQNFGTTPTLTATADSATGTDNLTVSFSSSTTGVCTITSGGALTFVTAGSCTIDADQAGDAATNAAPTVSRTFTVNAVVPGAPTIGTATAGNTQATVTFTAPANTGGAAILAGGYTVTANPGGATGTGSSSPVTVNGLINGVSYTFTVTATNSAGTGAASAASNSIIPASPQTITFANPGTKNFGTSPTLTASSSAGGGYVVTFTSSTTSVCTITSGGVLTFITAGTCTINADQAGDSSFLAAPQVSQSFSVSPVVPGAPTIGTAIAGDTQASVAFVAPVNIGGSAITGYTVTVSPPDVAPINGASSPIVVTGLTNGQAYTFTVTADNVAGSSPASAASNSITPAATQTITFAAPSAQNFGTTPTLIATTDATGLTPTFTSSTPAVCTITSGGALTFVTAGTCTINADQAGNGTYLPAPQVTRSFTVSAVVPGAPTIGTATAGNTQATVAFTAPASTGGSAITGYTVTASPGGATATGAGSPVTFTGLINGTSYTFTVSATNGVGAGSPSAASNAVTPSLPSNNAPVITQGGSVSVTMSEDGAPTPFSLSLTATDSDSDPLSWSISGSASNGVASVAGGSVSYTPTANFSGSDSFVVQVSDGDASATIDVSVTVTPVNDAPTISGTPVLSLDQDTAYSFTPTAADVDTADVLTFSISNKPGWASFNATTGALTGTPGAADVGNYGGIVISVSDANLSTALAAFNIEVIATIDPLQPVVTPPADIEINATALYTPLTLRQLLSVADNISQEQLDQILNGMASDGVSGKACCTTKPEGLNANNILLLPPGRHEVSWKATNAAGVSGTATQIVQVKPLVSLSKSQVALRGSDVELRVILNGESPQYPLTVPVRIDEATTATAAEYQVAMTEVVFTEPGQLEVVIPVKLAPLSGINDSQLIFALGATSNNGSASRHVIDIRQGNVAPVVVLDISQGGVSTGLVTPNGGPVTVSTSVTDLNDADTHSFDWSTTKGLADIDGNNTDAGRSFDPSTLTGSYEVSVAVTDSAGAVVSAQVYFRVVANLPVLSAGNDTDLDGVSDTLEGTGDTDGNGIPNYLDNMPSPNILPQQGNVTNAYLIECDPGVRCGLGLFALGGASGGVQIQDEEVNTIRDLVVDPAFAPVGGIFDFAIRDLPTAGQSVRVVIPQRAPIPVNAVYRKYQQGVWRTFVEDANNALHSASGNPGYCPPPGDITWTAGLTPDICVCS